jgi:3-oxoacid CoA-transferase subunit A
MKKDVLVFQNPDDMLAQFIEPNMHIHISATIGRPNALINSLARVFKNKNPDFTISTVAFHSTAHVLALKKMMKKNSRRQKTSYSTLFSVFSYW